MLVKREWSELRQGDSIYLPDLKRRATFIQERDSEASLVYCEEEETELLVNHNWDVMLFEGIISYEETVAGWLPTGNILWTRVDG